MWLSSWIWLRRKLALVITISKVTIYICVYIYIYIYIYILYNIILVNKPLSVVGILEDNAQGWKIVWKMNSWPRSEALRATVKFWWQSFSWGHYPQIYQQNRNSHTSLVTVTWWSRDRKILPILATKQIAGFSDYGPLSTVTEVNKVYYFIWSFVEIQNKPE